MNKEVFTYLRSYSFAPGKVDRLITSAYLYSRNLQNTDNRLLQSLLIKKRSHAYKNLIEFLEIHTFSDIEELIEAFEFVISPQEKVVTGAVYTPKYIREYIVEQCFSKITHFKNIKVCDPACGCAGFLSTAAKLIREKTKLSYRIIFKKNIFGLDIQKYSVTRSKILLTLMAVEDGERDTDYEFNLYQGNALNFDWSTKLSNYKGFTVVISNPPYVCSRNIDKKSKKYLSHWKVCASGHPDLYIPFFQIGLENLKPKGILGFITMNTFFKSINGRALREYFEKEKLTLSILDFSTKQVFQNKSTYTCICIIHKRPSDTIKYARSEQGSLQKTTHFETVHYSKLNHRMGWNLQSFDLLNRIENAGPSFGQLYQTRSGIATLKNYIYIFDPIKEDDKYYYLQNGRTFSIEKSICRETINPNKLTQVDDINILRQKAIFPYQYDGQGNAVLLSENDFKMRYPKAYAYLKDKKSILATRDKGKGSYKEWYAYGRNQSLEKYNKKLFFPHITSTIPNFSISTDENLLFYNGLAVISEDELDLKFLKKLMSSNLFWFYIQQSSKPYGSGYFSLSRTYIKHFGIYPFSNSEKNTIANSDMDTVNTIIESSYEIDPRKTYSLDLLQKCIKKVG